MRKTIKIAHLTAYANNLLLHLPDNYVAQRKGIIMLLEQALHSTGTYAGFNYLDEQDMTKSDYGTSVGVREQLADGSWDFDDTDRTRVRYY